MRRVLPFLAAGVLWLAAADPLLAQQRLFALTAKDVVEVDTSLPSLGRVVRRTSLPADARTSQPQAVSAAGGALLIWTAVEGKVALFDTRTGAVQTYALPGFVFTRVLGTDAGSYRVALAGWIGAPGAQSRVVAVADVRTGGVQVLNLGPEVDAGALTYAGGVDLLFVARPRPGTTFPAGREFFDVDVISVASGAILKSLPIGPVNAIDLAVDSAGTRLFVTGKGGGLFAFNVPFAEQVASFPAYPQSLQTPIVDEHRGRVLSAQGGYSGATLDALSFDTLKFIGRAAVPALNLAPGGSPYPPTAWIDVDVSNQSATIFAFETVLQTFNYFGVLCRQSTLAAVDVATGALRAAADFSAVTGSDNCAVNLVRITEPGAPGALTAGVADHQVTFNWLAPDATISYELEAGSAPGLANITRLTVVDNHLTVDGVPSGVYYVRVRAVNASGKSAPSEELRVVVP